jgi:hypothetical protein
VIARAATAAAACALLLTACNPQPENTSASPSPTASATADISVDITAHGTVGRPITITQQKGNRLEYRLTAARSTGTAAQGVGSGTFYDAKVTFYQSSGNTLVASSPRALVNQGDAAQSVRMVDGVRAVTKDGHTLRCRELTYSDGDKTLHGDGDVVMTGPNGMRLTGNHFDSDIDLTNVRLR